MMDIACKMNTLNECNPNSKIFKLGIMGIGVIYVGENVSMLERKSKKPF